MRGCLADFLIIGVARVDQPFGLKEEWPIKDNYLLGSFTCFRMATVAHYVKKMGVMFN